MSASLNYARLHVHLYESVTNYKNANGAELQFLVNAALIEKHEPRD